jgi:hypothetical protein
VTWIHRARSSLLTAQEAAFSQFFGPSQSLQSRSGTFGRSGDTNAWPATVSCAEREATEAGHEGLQGSGTSAASARQAQRCLTPRSSGAPTAGHQARSGGTRYIFASPGLASCRWRPLSSNVRQHKRCPWRAKRCRILCLGFRTSTSTPLRPAAKTPKSWPRRPGRSLVIAHVKSWRGRNLHSDQPTSLPAAAGAQFLLPLRGFSCVRVRARPRDSLRETLCLQGAPRRLGTAPRYFYSRDGVAPLRTTMNSASLRQLRHLRASACRCCLTPRSTGPATASAVSPA